MISFYFKHKVKEYLGDESRGPYRSTYCETYVIDGKAGGISIQVNTNYIIILKNIPIDKIRF